MSLKLELPVGFDDEIYLITKGNTIYKTMGLTEIIICEKSLYYKCGPSGFTNDDIDKTAFTSRSSAEKVLTDLLKGKLKQIQNNDR